MTVATTDRPQVHHTTEAARQPSEPRGESRLESRHESRHESCLESRIQPRSESTSGAGLMGWATLAAALPALPGCGGGDDATATALADDGGRVTAQAASGGQGADAGAELATPTREEASRFLSQAGLGGTVTDINQVRASGSFDAWLSTQFNTAPSQSYVKLISPGGKDADRNNESPNAGGRFAVQRALWRKLITGKDVLRQRVTLALSEIFVVSVNGIQTGNKGFAAAAYMDILERNTFGNLRDLLMQVSTSAAMGSYLTFQGNRKANTTTGSQPDENYARELMQLFTIGLVKLNLDGTPVLKDGAPEESYTQDDVLGLARVFTGWFYNNDNNPETDKVTKPMRQDAKSHEPGLKKFLGIEIPPSTNGEDSLRLAIDALMAHPNIGPFIGRQLIQRLVKSNPSPAYVARVATAFNNNGATPGVKGDMKATLRAVLLDAEAREPHADGTKNGKLREPMLRFLHWARIVKLSESSKNRYDMGDLSSAAYGLGQGPLQSPSVFNFFRPGFVPPGGQLGPLGITAPEFQITNESSVAGYLNFMQKAVVGGVAGSTPDYAAFAPLVAKPDASDLLKELNVLLAAGQVSARTLSSLARALNTIVPSNDKNKSNRMHAAILLMLAAPEYLVQK
jgi:uncharacterized protein (DUF1800 family)